MNKRDRSMGDWEALIQRTQEGCRGAGTFALVFTLSDGFEPADLRAAFAEVALRYDALRARVVEGPRGLRWRVSEGSAGSPVEIVEHAPDPGALGLLGLRDVFPRGGWQWRVRVARRAAAAAPWGLVFSANHALLDGRSVIALVGAVFSALGGAATGPGVAMVPPVESLLPPPADAVAPAATSVDGGESPARPAPFDRACPVDARRASWVVEDLARSTTAHAVATARRLGVSVNSLLAAALLSAAAEGEDARIGFGTAIDYRLQASPPLRPDSVGSLSGVVTTTCAVRPSEGVAALARRYQGGLAARLEAARVEGFFPRPSPAGALAPDGVAPAAADGVFDVELALSNLGVVDVELPGVAALYGGTSTVQGAFGLALTALTLDGRMHLSWSFAEPLMSRARVDRVRARVRQVLERLPTSTSPAQQQMWLLDRTASDRATYNVGFRLRFSAGPDVGAVRRALAEIVRRHAPLRTVYAQRDGRIEGVVEPPGSVDLAATELSHLPPTERRRQACRLERADLRAPFDLETGPVYRFRLVSVDEADHRLLVVVHHVAFDAWSMDVFRRELSSLYRALTDPAARRALRPLRADYAGFTRRLERHLASDRYRAQLAWWVEHLEGLAPPTLPTDRPGGASRDDRGGWLSVEVPPDDWCRLVESGRRQDCSPHLTLCAVVAIWVHRISGADDFALGVPMTLRERSGEYALIGNFVNVLPWRCAHADAVTFEDVLDAVRREGEAVRARRMVPLPEIVRAVGDHGRAPQLLRVVSTLEARAAGPHADGGLLGELDALTGSGTAKFDLTLHGRLERGRLRLGVEYRRALFDRASVERLVACLVTLASGLAADPRRPWRAFDIRPLEMRRAIAGFGGPADPRPPTIDVSAMIARHAAERPADVAVRRGDVGWSYGRLDRAAGAIAAHLRCLDLGDARRVAVCAAHSLEATAALVGIWRAGGAYVPIDPDLPPARVAGIVRDCGARVLLVGPGLEGTLAGLAPRVETIDAVLEEAEGSPSPDASPPIDARAAAYVIYTSGSTGAPKGVVIDHGALGTLVAWHRRAHRLTPTSVVSLYAAPAFDASVWELWPALAAGALVEVVPQPVRLRPRALRDWLIRRAVEVAFVPTPMAERLLALRWPTAAPLRALLTGGDRLTVWRPPGLPFDLYNYYGPTECTVLATGGPVPEATPGAARFPPIGRPLPYVAVRVVDRHDRPVPVGVPGELLVGGPTVARGYLGRPALTAGAFFESPGGDDRRRRWYRTGDRVRWRDDGLLDFIERLDSQVQIRGHRVELGEVEATLAEARSVRRAVAVLHRPAQGPERLVAYLVGTPAMSLDEVRAFVAARLPGHMVPSTLVRLDALPLDRNGKVDRRRLPPPDAPPVSEGSRPSDAVERAIADIWCSVLGVPAVETDRPFFDLGGHSLLLAEVGAAIEQRFGLALSIAELMCRPTVRALARHVGASIDGSDGSDGSPGPVVAAPESIAAPAARSHAIAVIGMAGRFPGAADVAALWRLVVDGREGLTRLDVGVSVAAEGPPATPGEPVFVPVSGHLPDADAFDAAFFGLPVTEARLIDPQHRLLLECGWTALEDAGIDPSRAPGRVGVFAGAGAPRYWLERAAAWAGDDDLRRWRALIGNAADAVATRLAHHLGLTGPAVGVQSACSTSLVALHMACRSLRVGDCDLALAGGASLHGLEPRGYTHRPGMILSPDGHCRPFDASAGGTVTASGVGLVVLKRLSDAVADRDPVRAVIRGSAVNNDGGRAVGFTAPSGAGQQAVLALAYRDAGLSPASVGYVEAHGTGTRLGDPVEFAALDAVYRAAEAPVGGCALGALKANVGHLDAAAGVAGFIKACLVVERGIIPPLVHFTAPNPDVRLAGSPFRVPRVAETWPEGRAPRRAAVSALGIGGTNAHVVLEEPPPPPPTTPDRRWQVLPLSARSPEALDAVCDALAAYFAAHPEADVADVAATLQLGRRAHRVRRAAVGRAPVELADALRARDPRFLGPVVTCAEAAPSVVFLLPGSGSQFEGMGAGLYDDEPVFAAVIDVVSRRLEARFGWSLRAAFSGEGGGIDWADPARFMPLIVALEIALGRLLISWGVVPDALLGHSLGEIAAAALSGVLDDADAVALAAARGGLCAEVVAGGMLYVAARPEDLRPRLFGSLEISVFNEAEGCIASGSSSDIEALERALAEGGVSCKRLRTRFPAHSRLVEPIMGRLEAIAASITHRPIGVPFISSVTGGWWTAAEVGEPGYWARHLRAPARFDRGLTAVLEGRTALALEVGPRRALSGLLGRHPARSGSAGVATLPGDGSHARRSVLRAVGRLWSAGGAVDWRAMHRGQRARVSLPTHPFEQVRHRLPRGDVARRPEPAAPARALRVVRPGWRAASATRDPRPSPGVAAARWWVLVSPDSRSRALADALIGELSRAGAEARGIGLGLGLGLGPADPPWSGPILEAHRGGDPRPAVRDLIAALGRPDRVVCLYPGTDPTDPADLQALEQAVLVPAWVSRGLSGAIEPAPCRLDFVTLAGDPADGEGEPPASDPLSAVVRVLRQESAPLDVALTIVEPGVDARGLSSWLARTSPEPVSRLGRQAVRSPAALAVRAASGPVAVRAGGVYAITGGTGGLGLALAAHLGGAHGARVALLARTVPDAADPRRAALGALGAGDRTMWLAADVRCPEALERAFERVRREWGVIHGVVHAAGVFDVDFAHRFDGPRARAVIEPKVAGARHLLRALRGHPPDFVALCSSGSALEGGVGLAPYAAANAALDAVARSAGDAFAGHVFSIAWGGLDVGGAGSPHARFAPRLASLYRAARAADRSRLSRREIGPAFEAALAAGLRHVRVVPDVQGARAPTASARVGSAVDRSALEGGAGCTDAPRDGGERVVEAVRAAWRQCLGVEPAGPDAGFFESGGSSLLVLELVDAIEAALSVRVPVDGILQRDAFGAVVDLTRHRVAGREAAGGRAVALNPAPGRRPLFLFPPAGGSLLAYRALAASVGARLPLVGVRLPGVDGRGPLPGSVAEASRSFAAEVRRRQPSGPYRLGGSSLGGVWAYEVARILCAAGEPVERVVMFDTPGPGDVDGIIADEAEARAYLGDLAPDLLRTIDDVRARPVERGAPSDLARFYETFLHNSRLLQRYATAPWGGRVLFYRAVTRDAVNPARPEARWLELATGGVEVCVVSGNHVTMLEPPHVHRLADHLVDRLTPRPSVAPGALGEALAGDA